MSVERSDENPYDIIQITEITCDNENSDDARCSVLNNCLRHLFEICYKNCSCRSADNQRYDIEDITDTVKYYHNKDPNVIFISHDKRRSNVLETIEEDTRESFNDQDPQCSNARNDDNPHIKSVSRSTKTNMSNETNSGSSTGSFNMNFQYSSTSSRLHFSDAESEDRLYLQNIDHGSKECIFDSSSILKILSDLNQAFENNWDFTKDLYEQMLILLNQSEYKNVRSFLINNNFLETAKMILTACDQSWLIKKIICVITNLCYDDETIDLIGNDKYLTTAILHYFQADLTISIELLGLLLLITYRIQKNPQSIWTSHLTNCEFLENSIIFMLNNLINDDILMIIRLLQFLYRISLLRHTDFLRQLFDLNKLTTAMLTSFMQVILEKNEVSTYLWRELVFIESWLTIMSSARGLDLFIFDEKEKFLQLMEVIYRILQPYKELSIIFLILSERTDMIRNIRIIHKCINLLQSLHYGINIPLKVDNTVANMISNLKADLTALEPEGKKLNISMVNLLDRLTKYWIYIVKLSRSVRIIQILQPCNIRTREYLIHLVQSNFERLEETGETSEVLGKIKEVDNFFKPIIV